MRPRSCQSVAILLSSSLPRWGVHPRSYQSVATYRATPCPGGACAFGLYKVSPCSVVPLWPGAACAFVVTKVSLFIASPPWPGGACATSTNSCEMCVCCSLLLSFRSQLDDRVAKRYAGLYVFRQTYTCTYAHLFACSCTYIYNIYVYFLSPTN